MMSGIDKGLVSNITLQQYLRPELWLTAILNAAINSVVVK